FRSSGSTGMRFEINHYSAVRAWAEDLSCSLRARFKRGMGMLSNGVTMPQGAGNNLISPRVSIGTNPVINLHRGVAFWTEGNGTYDQDPGHGVCGIHRFSSLPASSRVHGSRPSNRGIG